jgi:hypothetical protein
VFSTWSLDVIKNCWIKTNIFNPIQSEKLRSGVRCNNRVASDESSGLPPKIVDSLFDMLKNMGRKLALPNNPPIAMASDNELLDMAIERIIEAPPLVMDASRIVVEEVEDDVDEQEDFASDLEVDEVEALPPLSLREARDYCNRLLEFVTINHHFVKREGPRNNHHDYIRDLDAISQALDSMRETNSTRQSSLMSWVVRASPSITSWRK